MNLVNSLYISEHGAKIGVEKGAITVWLPEQGKTRVPMAGIERITLLGRASISNEAMARCTQAGIRIVAMHASGRFRFAVGGPSGGNVLLRVEQLRAFDQDERGLPIAQSIVAGKIQNSAQLVQRWLWESSGSSRELLARELAALNERAQRVRVATDFDTVRGIEGDAARQYFKAMGHYLSTVSSQFTFDRRSRRPPRDPMNALLSFGYGLLTTELIGAIEAVGLDHQIGFLHRLRPGRPSLALDLVEEFRSPLVDRFVVRCISRRQIRLEHLTQLPGGAWRLSDEGRRKYLGLWDEAKETPHPHLLLDREVPRWALPQVQATLLARHLRGDIGAYPPWIARA